MFAYFGLPKILQSDNGLEFKNKLMEEEINNWVGFILLLGFIVRNRLDSMTELLMKLLA